MLPVVLNDFKDDAIVSEANPSSLQAAARQKARDIINEHETIVAGAKGAVAFVGGSMVLVIYFICLCLAG